ncbi:MAG TPA: DUF3105 domain-containing protein [Polyangiaceae bacterium]|jgi:hypothetical protein|nr:DUF3105 domain-containing protein [Polyangiaceae bacterium]
MTHFTHPENPRATTTSVFALAFALVASTACSSSSAPPRPVGGTVCDRCGACEESRTVTSANHVLGTIDYADDPPTGGDHNPCWATWGVHTDVLPPENWVHNLEHGGIVFLYRSHTELGGDAGGVDGGTLSGIDALVQKLPRTLSTEYPPLPKRFALVSWGHRLVSDCIDLDAAQKFYTEHFNQGLEDIPDEPSCN